MSERGLAARIALRESAAGGDAGGFAPFEPPRRTRGAGWQRWQMGSLDPRTALQEIVHEAPAEPAPPPIDFAALDAMREGARKEGYAQGYTQGQTQAMATATAKAMHAAWKPRATKPRAAGPGRQLPPGTRRG